MPHLQPPRSTGRMRILITGSRNYRDLAMVEEAISDHIRGHDPRSVTIIHGDARGADTLAGTAARYYGLRVETHPADWNQHGKAAGPIRNQQMVNLGADVCLAFPAFPAGGSRGTWDCVSRAKVAGIPTYIYYEQGRQ